jgi:hypothetical protein
MEKFRKVQLRVKDTGGVIKERYAYTDEAEKQLREELNKDMYNWERSGQYIGRALEVVTVE